MRNTAKTTFATARLTCDKVRARYPKIRHLGYYDSFGKILYDSAREKLQPLEGVEEMHILNGTVASTLGLWKSSDRLLGRLDSFVMIREKIVALMIPLHKNGTYFLAIFDQETPISQIERVRTRIIDNHLT